MKEKIKIASFTLLLITILFFINPSDSNASTLYGYVCSGDSITCGMFNAIYKISKNNSNTFYICGGDSLSCSSLNAIYRVEKDDLDTYYICSGDSITCSFFNDIYTVEIDDADTMYICHGNSIVCGFLNNVYTVDIHDDDTMYICPGDSIVCGILNEIYRVELVNDTSEYNYDNYLCPENSTYQNEVCTCNPGYVVDNLDKSKCIFINQYCQEVYGANSYGSGKSCYCKDGYEWNSSRTACFKINITCPVNATVVNNKCVCNSGYIYSEGSDRCITLTTYCIIKYGSAYGVKKDNNTVICDCLDGYEWDPSGITCIEKVTKIPEEQILQKELEKEESEEIKQEENATKTEFTIERENKDNLDKQKEQNFLESIFNTIKNFFLKFLIYFK